MKDVFKFLKWKCSQKGSHFSAADLDIIKSNDFGSFAKISTKACSYTKDIMKKYVETIWHEKIKNQFIMEGEDHIPKPSCQKLPIPLHTTRRDEVVLMGFMYPQNLLNSFVYRNTYCTESPLCPRCNREEQTPYHVLAVCNANHQTISNLISELLSNEEHHYKDCTTILNCSRNSKFINLCLEVIKHGQFRDSIVLGQNPQKYEY